MIRDKKWKYVWNLSDVDELYDMENDPYELTNLAVLPEYADRLREMRLDMLRELEAVDDYTIRSYWLKEQLLYNRKPLR
jgi:arylsulfatase A-like enzyme